MRAATSEKAPNAANIDQTAGWIYRELGVEPIIQCAGVRTIYGASNPSAEVVAAMEAGAEAFVDMDELAEGIGRRLATLTGAEWGVVTAGTAATLALATAACIAGNDPELMLRLPVTNGLPHRVVIPSDQRFAYEQSIRIAGAQIISVDSAEDLEQALDGSVAMICVLGRVSANARLPLDVMAPIARAHGVPILVDAAGLSPQKPDRWIMGGADLVVYAGGKYLRAPQSTAIVIGSRNLCEAIWVNGAPHQAFGRSMKVGKEEMVGAVTALDRWINGASAAAERSAWRPRLDRIDRIVSRVPGIRTELMPSSDSVTATRLKITWNRELIPFNAEALRLALLDRRPRVLIHDFWSTESSIVVDPVNITDAEAEIAGAAIAEFLGSSNGRVAEPPAEAGADFTGNWELEINFLRGQARHRLELTQVERHVTGLHFARETIGAIDGEVEGRSVVLRVVHRQDPMSLFYTFKGQLSHGSLEGEVQLGASAREHIGPVFKSQFGRATWTASRAFPGDP